MVGSHGRFVWYELVTTDVAAATAFYSRVMGWGAWDASAPGKPYILFGDGKSAISALTPLPDDARQTGAEPMWVGYVGVDDVDATAQKITRLGGAVHVPPANASDISRFSVFTDPQAAKLALFKWLRPDQQPPAALDAPGRVGWHELLAADWERAWDFYGDLFGWQKEHADIGEAGTYQSFSAGGEMIGGMFTKPENMPVPFWLYYFNVGDLDATAQRVEAGGGQILEGPLEAWDGSWIIRCKDPQGAVFALEGPRIPKPVGYFERAATRDGSAAPRRKWSW
ncbi:MAG: VOC family protein [Xanthobacteraceae bacterium]